VHAYVHLTIWHLRVCCGKVKGVRTRCNHLGFGHMASGTKPPIHGVCVTVSMHVALQSYFAAAPNPTAQYAWVCPGPSRLDDSHSGACPESSTGGYRCCIDSKTGGAVTDDMCCPRNEKQLATKLLAPSTQSLAKRLTGTLEGLVLKLEKAAQPKPPPQADAEYMSRSEAQGDLNSYFDSLSSKPAPKRSLASKRAQEDLNGFFHELGKGTLAGLAFQRKPWKPPPLPDPSNEVKEVVRAYARQLHRDLEHKGVSVAKSEFEQWRQRAMGHRRRLSPLKVAAAEEDVQQQRAKEIGKETADRWNRKQVHYFTGAPGGKEERDGGELDLGDGLVGVRARQVRNIGSR
jgi:hypothetical protein